VVTFGLGFPFLRRRLIQFAAESHSYGTTRFALPEGFKKPFIRPISWSSASPSFSRGVGRLLCRGERDRRRTRKGGADKPGWMPTAIIAGVVVFYAFLFLQSPTSGRAP